MSGSPQKAHSPRRVSLYSLSILPFMFPSTLQTTWAFRKIGSRDETPKRISNRGALWRTGCERLVVFSSVTLRSHLICAPGTVYRSDAKELACLCARRFLHLVLYQAARRPLLKGFLFAEHDFCRQESRQIVRHAMLAAAQLRRKEGCRVGWQMGADIRIFSHFRTTATRAATMTRTLDSQRCVRPFVVFSVIGSTCRNSFGRWLEISPPGAEGRESRDRMKRRTFQPREPFRLWVCLWLHTSFRQEGKPFSHERHRAVFVLPVNEVYLYFGRCRRCCCRCCCSYLFSCSCYSCFCRCSCFCRFEHERAAAVFCFSPCFPQTLEHS